MSSAQNSSSLPDFLTSPSLNSLSLELDYPTFVPDFFKYLTSIDCSSNDLFVPQKFRDIQNGSLQPNWVLTMKNGYRMYVVYDRVNRKLSGMFDFFNDFGLIGGEILIFEYVDGSNFDVYIIGADGCEIDYAPFEKVCETSSEFFGSSNGGVRKFVKCVSKADPIVDEVLLPRSHMRMIGNIIPEWVTYLLKNKFMFGGHFDFGECKLTGLIKVCDGLKLRNYEKLELLVFTFDGGRFFNLSLFDGRNVEIALDINKISFGNLTFTLRYPCHFKVCVMPCHLGTYCPGLTIPVEFKNVTNMWKTNVKISVHQKQFTWELEIRKSRIYKRTAIYGRWVQFKNDLQLSVEDTCFFRWINESYHQFRVEIVRGSVIGS